MNDDEEDCSGEIMAGRSVETKGSKKLRYAVDQVRPLQLTAKLQERKTTSIIMLGPLFDKLIQFNHFRVDAFGNIKAKRQMFVEHCCMV